MTIKLYLPKSLLVLPFIFFACQSPKAEETEFETTPETTQTEVETEEPETAETSESEDWIDLNATAVDTTVDTEKMLYELMYKTQQLEIDAQNRLYDSINRAGSAAYKTKCAARTRTYLADLDKLNAAAKVWLETKKFETIPELKIAACWLENDGKSVTYVLRYPQEREHKTVTGYTWNDDTLCLPADFSLEKYASLQKAKEAGLVSEMPFFKDPEIVKATSVERIAYNGTSKAKQANYLRQQIDKILNLAQRDPKLKAKKLPSPKAYDSWEKKQNWTTTDASIKGRKIVLVKLSAQL